MESASWRGTSAVETVQPVRLDPQESPGQLAAPALQDQPAQQGRLDLPVWLVLLVTTERTANLVLRAMTDR